MRGGGVKLCPNIDGVVSRIASGRIMADLMSASRFLHLTQLG